MSDKVIYTHTDKEGKKWILANLRPSEMPGFYLADSGDKTLRLHRHDISIEKPKPKPQVNVQEDYSI
jgi:hypothetical protein